METGTIYFSMSDSKYQGRFEEFLHHSVHLGFPIATLAMIAFDKETYAYFSSAGVPTFLMDDATIPITKRVMNAKFMGTLALLVAGYEVYFGEMDIYWRAPPDASFFEGMNEFTVSANKYEFEEINIGFYYCRPTVRMIETMERLVWFLESPGHSETNEKKVLFDQKLFDLAVRGPGPRQVLTTGEYSNILNASEKEFMRPPEENYLSWRSLPIDVLEHWPIKGLDSERLVGVHVWSDMGPPEDQIAWAIRCFVIDRESRPSDCEKLTHLLPQ